MTLSGSPRERIMWAVNDFVMAISWLCGHGRAFAEGSALAEGFTSRECVAAAASYHRRACES